MACASSRRFAFPGPATLTRRFQSVFTRRVTEIVDELCGTQITFTQVSRPSSEFNEEFE